MKIFFLIIVSFLSFNLISAQKGNKKITITGTVLDARKSPIANAIIMIDNQKTSSLTDSKGIYKIKVKRNASKIGIFTFGNGIIEEDINGRTLINFNFGISKSQQPEDQNVRSGDEGVNVGYAYVKKKNLMSQVNHIDGTKKKYASYSSIYDMLQREVSGIQIYGTTIIIQDSKNLSGRIPPLLIVDGVYVNAIDNIPPAIVKSIDVLKGTSAAIYGSRGYGGVIIITTKSGNDK
jgi:TonB-dependent SusC/RagA subfamily outer membrane receptor